MFYCNSKIAPTLLKNVKLRIHCFFPQMRKSNIKVLFCFYLKKKNQIANIHAQVSWDATAQPLETNMHHLEGHKLGISGVNHVFLTCSWQPPAHLVWITRTTAFGKMGKSFVTYQEASITTGSPKFTGRIGS